MTRVVLWQWRRRVRKLMPRRLIKAPLQEGKVFGYVTLKDQWNQATHSYSAWN
jgi:hypothetical protein